MKKADYRKKIESIKLDIKNLNDLITTTGDYYIEANKPCELGDNVEIVLGSDRVVNGVVKSFGILKGSTVCVTSYTIGNNTKYITTPHKGIKTK